MGLIGRILLKNTQEGLQVDTSYTQDDTLFLNISSRSTIEIPSTPLEVNAHLPQKDGLEIFGLWAAIIGGIAGLIGAMVAFYQLFKRDEDKQNQLMELKNQTNQLIEQNKLFEKRIRMQVRPLIWSNGSGRKGATREFDITVNNRGQIAFLDLIKFIEGDKVSLRNWNKSIVPIEEEHPIKITGNYGSFNPEKMKFSFLIRYHDTENFQYETVFEWTDGRAKILETKDL